MCTGNICRSPMAERLAVEYAARRGIADFTASSAGTRAVVGHPIHPLAVMVLEELGGDAMNFAARRLTGKIASNADLVLTMTTAHRDVVLECAPRQLSRTFTLGEAARLAEEGTTHDVAELAARRPQSSSRQVEDIPDPMGRSLDAFARIGAQIAELLGPILELRRC